MIQKFIYFRTSVIRKVRGKFSQKLVSCVHLTFGWKPYPLVSVLQNRMRAVSTCLTKQTVIKLCDFVYSILTDQKLGKLSPNGRTLSAMGQLNERSRDNQLVVLVTLLLKG